MRADEPGLGEHEVERRPRARCSARCGGRSAAPRARRASRDRMPRAARAPPACPGRWPRRWCRARPGRSGRGRPSTRGSQKNRRYWVSPGSLGISSKTIDELNDIGMTDEHRHHQEGEHRRRRAPRARRARPAAAAAVGDPRPARRHGNPAVGRRPPSEPHVREVEQQGPHRSVLARAKANGQLSTWRTLNSIRFEIIICFGPPSRAGRDEEAEGDDEDEQAARGDAGHAQRQGDTPERADRARRRGWPRPGRSSGGMARSELSTGKIM